MKKLLVLMLALASMAITANEYDKRQSILLSQPQQAHVLQEMRSLLSGIQGILGALSTDDWEAVVEHARPLGMGMKKKPENQLHKVLPAEFMVLGKSVHRNFDLIANDAEKLKNPKHTLKQVSNTMLLCQGCHAIYRIEVNPL